jgi:hypothetical protein
MTENDRTSPSLGKDAGATQPQEPGQQCIVIGGNAENGAITVQPSQAFSDYETGKHQDPSGNVLGRLGAALQSVPSLLVAGEAKGKQLYEVVINGQLVRASDGNGLRAFSMGPKGIQEHARLFESGTLQNMINAAAVWQVASVVVAQKHLADISRKLDAITESVSSISRFLDNERQSRIEAAWRYLAQAKSVLSAGETPVSMRIQLEQCEWDLTEIQIHLHKEFRQLLAKPVSHGETVGTEDLARDISGKMTDLEAVLKSLELCLQTRIVAWHVLSLFPGEPALKDVRYRDILQAANDLDTLMPAFDMELERDIGSVDSFFTSGSTLRQRRAALREQAEALSARITAAWSTIDSGIRNAARMLRLHDEPVRLLLQYEDGALTGMRQAVP